MGPWCGFSQTDNTVVYAGSRFASGRNLTYERTACAEGGLLATASATVP